MEGLVSLKSKHRKEITSAENEIDEAHAKQLEQARDMLTEQAKVDLKVMEDEMVERVREDGEFTIWKQSWFTGCFNALIVPSLRANSEYLSKN